MIGDFITVIIISIVLAIIFPFLIPLWVILACFGGLIAAGSDN